MNSRRCAIVLFLLAVVLRVVFSFAYPNPFPQLEGQYRFYSDQLQWDEEAKNLIAGKGISNTETLDGSLKPSRTSYVFYVLYVALMFILFGIHYVPIFIGQVAMNVLAGFIVYVIGKKYLFREDMATNLIFLIFFCLYFPYFRFANILDGATLLTLLIACMLLLFIIAVNRESILLFAVAGGLCGLATLTRFTMQLFPCILILILVIYAKYGDINKTYMSVFKKGMMLLIGFVIVMSPWYYRNFKLEGEVSPPQSDMGFLLWKFNVPKQENFHYFAHTFRRDISIPESEKNRIYFKEALENMSAQPGKAIKNLVDKCAVFWLNNGANRKHSLASVILAAINSILLFLSIFGYAVSSRRTKLLALPIVLLILYLTAIHTLFYGTIVHSLVLTPYMLLFAAKGLNVMMMNFRFWKKYSKTICQP